MDLEQRTGDTCALCCVGMCSLTPPMPDNWHWCSIERGGSRLRHKDKVRPVSLLSLPHTVDTGHWTQQQTPVFWAYLPSIQNIITGLLTTNFKISGTIIFMCMLKSMGLERSMTRGTLTWWLHILMRMTRACFLIKRSQLPWCPELGRHGSCSQSNGRDCAHFRY